jgi:uncharacterized protein YpmB
MIVPSHKPDNKHNTVTDSVGSVAELEPATQVADFVDQGKYYDATGSDSKGQHL